MRIRFTSYEPEFEKIIALAVLKDGLNLGELINAQCSATMHALVQEGISVDVIELERLDEASTGFLIYYFELLTSATGIMLGINTYDQPGVEVGKRILKTMLTAGK